MLIKRRKKAYYILNKGYKLRGWKGLPFALTYPDLRNTEFFDREIILSMIWMAVTISRKTVLQKNRKNCFTN